MRMPWSGSKESRNRSERQSITDLLFNRAKMHWWLLGVIFVLAVIWTVLPMEDERRLLNPDDFRLSEKSPRNVFAQINAAYHEAATEEDKQKALTEVPPVFNLDFQMLENAREEFRIIRQVRANQALTDAEKVTAMKRLLYIGFILDDAVALILATATDEEIDAAEKGVIGILSDILAEGVIASGDNGSFAERLSKIDYIKPKWERIRKKLEMEIAQKVTEAHIASKMSITLVDVRSDPDKAKIVLVEELRDWDIAKEAAQEMAKDIPEPIGAMVIGMSLDLIRPNLTYDPDLTLEHQESMLDNFPPVSQEIGKGDKIVAIGEIVTENVKGKLEAIASAQKHAIIRSIPGAVLLTALLAYILIVYLRKYEPSIFSEPRKVIALNLAILLVLLLGNILITWKPTLKLFLVWGPELKIDRPGFFIPAALASIVIAML